MAKHNEILNSFKAINSREQFDFGCKEHKSLVCMSTNKQMYYIYMSHIMKKGPFGYFFSQFFIFVFFFMYIMLRVICENLSAIAFKIGLLRGPLT